MLFSMYRLIFPSSPKLFCILAVFFSPSLSFVRWFFFSRTLSLSFSLVLYSSLSYTSLPFSPSFLYYSFSVVVSFACCWGLCSLLVLDSEANREARLHSDGMLVPIVGDRCACGAAESHHSKQYRSYCTRASRKTADTDRTARYDLTTCLIASPTFRAFAQDETNHSCSKYGM